MLEITKKFHDTIHIHTPTTSINHIIHTPTILLRPVLFKSWAFEGYPTPFNHGLIQWKKSIGPCFWLSRKGIDIDFWRPICICIYMIYDIYISYDIWYIYIWYMIYIYDIYIWYDIILYYIILYYTILYYNILYYIILNYIILSFLILYYIILNYIILYYIILYKTYIYIYIHIPCCLYLMWDIITAIYAPWCKIYLGNFLIFRGVIWDGSNILRLVSWARFG